MVKTRRLKVMWTSNAPWSYSGYGTQTKDIEQRFVHSGWNTSNFALINMWGHAGSPFRDEYHIMNFPNINHTQGSDAMVHHGRNWGADIIIGLFDIWPQNPQDLMQIPRFIPWLPVDYDPVPKQITNNLRFANRIIAMSKFGQKQLQGSGFASIYIPHHVNTEIFKPLNREEIRKKFKISPDVTIFGMVSENKSLISRKSYMEILDAFAIYVKTNPNCLLYLHTDPDFPGGFPIKQYAEFLKVNNHLAFPDSYQLRFDSPREHVAELFNLFDVFLNPSSSEGFGIPIIEAQACGIPVIVNDWTSMPELIKQGATGMATKRGYRVFVPAGGYMQFPDVNSLVECMIKVSHWDKERTKQQSVQWIAENFSLDYVWENKWLPFLERVETELYGLMPEVPVVPQPGQAIVAP